MTAVLAPTTFDVCGPLPEGTTVLEASAGTGKTFTIAALAARYVAEGVVGLDQLMLVTFGRDATQELRERVRERLAGTERALSALLTGEPAGELPGDADGVTALLAAGPPEQVRARRDRLAAAIAGFDSATIATTHQFCQQMLAGLGVAGDNDPDAEFVEHVDDVVTEVVDDFYVRKYAAPGAARPAFDRKAALELARRAVGDPQARLEPAGADPRSAAAVRRGFAEAVRAEVDRRKRTRRLYSYDDMLGRLAGALADPVRGAAACDRLRARYRVVLVDEFQDTDPQQWEILRRAFHRVPGTTLVLIGDPKQAIYAFRGADVVSYLAALDEADVVRTLGRNYRSDAALLGALDALLRGAALGDDRILVRPVDAEHAQRRLRGAPSDSPVRLRVVDRDRLEPLTGRKLGTTKITRPVVARDVALDLSALLASPALVDGEPVRPGHVAVLVRTNAQGTMVRDACAAHGVPAVVAGSTSVFGTDAAADWLTLLEAVEQPQRVVRLRAAALTRFVGHTVADLCGPDGDGLVDDLGADLRAWHVVLAERGVAALLEAVTTRRRPAERLLSRPDGERALTDIRHIGQVLHSAALERHLGPSALIEWLRHRIGEAARDTAAERSRRLESDADAVQIVTVHRSKGLEFPVVYLPFAWDRWVADTPDPLLYHDPDGSRVLDVGGPSGPDRTERTARHQGEEAGEDLRLLYVALTRARSQVVVWWAPATTTPASALHRLLLGRPGAGQDPPASVKVPGDANVLQMLRELEPSGVAVETLTDREPATAPPGDPAPELAAAAFDRTLDTAWRRTSYTSLTASAHASVPVHVDVEEEQASPAGVLSEPETEGTRDEPLDPPAPGAPADEATGGAGVAAVPSPMAELPMGAGFGTLVHAVLETVDTGARDLGAELAARAREELARQPADVDPDELAAALLPVLRTPLGPVADGYTLADVAPVDRLSELEFEMPLCGGDSPAGTLRLGRVAELLARHLDGDDPLAGYADRLAVPGLAEQPLRGYLTGSIDSVLRLGSGSGSGPGARYLVVDYKTNWLGPIGPAGREPLTAAHYAPSHLAAAMQGAHYPLQALLYAVALHRFLRWRLPGYDPATHLGGVGYLFLRGMCGPDTPVIDGSPCGVFGWRPPAALVCELSDLLDGDGT
ncbi:UvrD-helicase domain-containing protein [Pseudonocardia sp. KRD291]|uniref:UvrD-helicase domain-containing protein n=1 Tax=Pseudonocardia sp. KRD291 TaxID=2792007 RepID=UPI001C4A3B91|nr:UvrD-helicase domain-containing protein [Pseudonocardia sp. KRD291]MBW0104820.1 UvrD-helicase domain-containing protein [Pseudonocardia sp. KRD291]